LEDITLRFNEKIYFQKLKTNFRIKTICYIPILIYINFIFILTIYLKFWLFYQKDISYFFPILEASAIAGASKNLML